MTHGTIEFDGGSVGADTTRTHFLAIHPDARLVIENGPNRTYRLGPIVALRRTVVANLSFRDEQVRMITFVVPRGDGSQWSEFTDRDLAAEKARNDVWLSTEWGVQGGSTSFLWGRIESIVDKKTGCAPVIVTYYPTQP